MFRPDVSTWDMTGKESISPLDAFNQNARLTGMLKNHLLSCSFKDIFLDGILGHKSINVDMILLSDTMCSSHCLQICLRIPIAVEDDDRVGCFQVNT